MNHKTTYLFLIIFSFLCLCNCSLSIDPDLANTVEGSKIIRDAVHIEFLSFLLPFISGTACIIGGIILTILGFSGNITWIVEVSGFTSRLANASPGIILIIIGALLICSKKYEVRIQKENEQKKVRNPWKIAFFILTAICIITFLLICFLIKY